MKVFFCPFFAVEEATAEIMSHCPWLCVFVCGRPLCVTLVFSTKGQRYLRVGLAVPLFGSVACLRRMVADEGKLSPDQVTYWRIKRSEGRWLNLISASGSEIKEKSVFGVKVYSFCFVWFTK